MKYITETLRTPVGEAFDVVVAGAGPAGCCAAIAAARAGAKTLLVEQAECFGGMWTTGLVNPVFDYANKSGILIEILDRLKGRCGFGGFIRSCYQIEDMKQLLDELLTESGAALLTGTTVSAVLKDGNTVTGLVVENKGGRIAYPAKAIIDCTGDGDVCARAGAATAMGGEDELDIQAMTLMFLLDRIRFDQQGWYDLCQLIEQAAEKNGSDYKLPYRRPYIIQAPGNEQAVVQLTHMRNKNPLDGFDHTAAMIEGRKQAHDVYLFMKENIPQFKDISLGQTAAMLGVRESRRLVGEYVLPIEDCLAGKIPADSVTVATFNVDIHNNKNQEQSHFDVMPYGIPYRCLVPKEVDGLLAAGRCISGTHESEASYRVTGNCAAMGQAAGAAAALSAKLGCRLRELPFAQLSALLTQQGYVMPTPNC